MEDGRSMKEWVSFYKINVIYVFIQLANIRRFLLIDFIFTIGNKTAIGNFAKIGPDRNLIFDCDFISDCENKVDWRKTKFI